MCACAVCACECALASIYAYECVYVDLLNYDFNLRLNTYTCFKLYLRWYTACESF